MADEQIPSLQPVLEEAPQSPATGVNAYVPNGVNWTLISENSVDPGHKHTQVAGTYRAGEAIAKSAAVSLYPDNTQDQAWSTQNTDRTWGDDSSRAYIAQSFTPGTTGFITAASVYLKKSGSPSDNITIAIYSGASQPSATGLIVSKTIAGSSLTTSYAYYTVDFDDLSSLTASTTYWIVLSRSGAIDASNYYVWGYDNTGNTYGSFKTGSALGSMVSVLNIDTEETTGVFIEYTGSTTASVVRESVASSATSVENFIGFAETAATDGGTLNVIRVGTVSGLSNIVPGDNYFLSNTSGDIATIAGTYIKSVAIGKTSTSVDILGTQPRQTTNIRFGGVNTDVAVTTDNETTVASATVTGGTLASNGVIRVTVVGSGATNEQEINFKYGGSTFSSVRVGGGGTSIFATAFLANRNSTSSQVGSVTATDSAGDRDYDIITGLSVDSTADQTLSVTSDSIGVGSGTRVTYNMILFEIIA